MSTLLSAVDAVNYLAAAPRPSDGGNTLGSGSSLLSSGSAGMGISLLKLLLGLFTSTTGSI